MVDIKQQLYQVWELIQKSHIVIPNNAVVEVYHHKGIDKFLDVGAVFIKIVNKEYCKSYVVQLPGQHYPEHYHKLKIETFYVLFGKLIVDCEGRTTVLDPSQSFSVQRGESHSFFSETGTVFEELSTTYLKNDSIYSDTEIQHASYEQRKTLLPFGELLEVFKCESIT